MTDHHGHLSTAWVETIAGLSAGTASTLASHPLDVIKTRLQIHRSLSSTPLSSFAVLRSLLRNDRPVQALYRGLTPNLLGNASSWALFFYVKQVAEAQLRLFHSRDSHSSAVPEQAQIDRQDLSPLDYFISSGVSGLAITIATNPIWVLKTRMLSSDRNAKGAYPSTWSGLASIYRHEGWRGFYKGLAISCVGIMHGAVQFATYDSLKKSWQKRLEDEGEEEKAKISNAATVVLSGTSKVVAGTAVYPYQVVRSRLQTYDAEESFGKGIRGVARSVWREEGWRGFYRGLGPNIVRVLPSAWVTFLVYENVRYYLPRMGDAGAG